MHSKASVLGSLWELAGKQLLVIFVNDANLLNFSDISIGSNVKVGLYWRPPGADIENINKNHPPVGEYRFMNLANEHN